MNDPFIQKMRAKQEARRIKLDKLAPYVDNKENSTTAVSSTRATFSAKSVLNEKEIIAETNFRELSENNVVCKPASPIKSKSPVKTSTCQLNIAHNRPTDIDSVQINSKTSFHNEEKSPVKTNVSGSKPKLGALARLTSKMKEWDDDYTYHSTSQGAQTEVDKCDATPLHDHSPCNNIASNLHNNHLTSMLTKSPVRENYKVAQSPVRENYKVAQSPVRENQDVVQSPKTYHFGDDVNALQDVNMTNTASACFSPSNKVDLNKSTPTKKLVWDRKLLNSLEAQGFTPSESKSRLIYDFDKERRSRSTSPSKASPTRKYNANLPTVKSTSNMPPTPPPPPKVLSCVLKSRDNSPVKSDSVRDMSVSPVKENKRSTSPSKVTNLLGKWEEHIRQASPERKQDRGYSRSPTRKFNQQATEVHAYRSRPTTRMSRAELHDRRQEEKDAEPLERSRSPVKSCSSLYAQDNKVSWINQQKNNSSKSYGVLPSNADNTNNTTSVGHTDRLADKGRIIKGSSTMPDVSPLIPEPHTLSVKDKAAVFDVGRTKRVQKDPAELSLQDRRGIFEKQKGTAPLIPRAPFGQSVPARVLHSKEEKDVALKSAVTYSRKVERPEKQKLASTMPATSWPISKERSPSPTRGNAVMEAQRRIFQQTSEDKWHGNDINTKIQSERQKEMEILVNRFRRPNNHNVSNKISSAHLEDTESEYVESDESYAESTASSEMQSVEEKESLVPGPPKPPRMFIHPASSAMSINSTATTDHSPSPPRNLHRLNSTELGESPRKDYIPKIKPGCMFPCLSDIESHSEVADSQSEEDDVANSSFAESVLTCASMDSLGCQIKKLAERNHDVHLNVIPEDSTMPASQMDMTTTTIDDMGAIDDAIDEALFDEPTPPKKLKPNNDDNKEFKTPKIILSNDTSTEGDVSLAHSISMYRKQRPVEINVTPVRKIIRKCEVPTEPSSPVSPSVNISARIRDLQQQESKQLSVISQASGALSVVAQHPEQQGTLQHIEAEKLLLVASQKRLSAQNEIQRLKAEGALTTKSWGTDPEDSCRGSLSISSISLPLKEQFLTKGMSGNKVYHLMVLVKHRDQVISSELLTTPDCVVEKSVTFPNLISLHDLTSDFNITLEVYMLTIEGSQNIQTIKKEQSRLKLTPLKRLHKMESRVSSPAVQSPGGPYAVRTSAFQLVGFTHLNISTLTRNAWALEKVPFNSPFDGHLIMKVGCSMEGGESECSFLTMFEDVGGFGSWNRRWCVLSGTTIRFWRYPDDQNKKECQGCLDLRYCTTRKVELVSRDICARMHTFELVLVRSATPADVSNLVQEVRGSNVISKILLSADSREERLVWCDKLNRTLANIRAWDPDALRPEDFHV